MLNNKYLLNSNIVDWAILVANESTNNNYYRIENCIYSRKLLDDNYKVRYIIQKFSFSRSNSRRNFVKSKYNFVKPIKNGIRSCMKLSTIKDLNGYRGKKSYKKAELEFESIVKFHASMNWIFRNSRDRILVGDNIGNIAQLLQEIDSFYGVGGFEFRALYYKNKLYVVSNYYNSVNDLGSRSYTLIIYDKQFKYIKADDNKTYIIRFIRDKDENVDSIYIELTDNEVLEIVGYLNNFMDSNDISIYKT